MGALNVDAAEYRAFTQRLRGAERSVANGLRRRIREAGKPLAEGVLQDGPEGLPERGGLSGWLRQSKGTTSLTQARLEVKLSRGGKHDLAAINRGRLRHPVFGNRGAWAGQDVEAGTYDRAIDKHAALALDDLARVVDDVMGEL